MLQRVVFCCSVLRDVAVCSSVLQCVAGGERAEWGGARETVCVCVCTRARALELACVCMTALCCNVLQCWQCAASCMRVHKFVHERVWLWKCQLCGMCARGR